MMRLWLLALAAALLAAAPATARPVAVDGGHVRGITLPSGVRAWLGVPFAAPPVRDLRWRAPQPVVPWPGIRNADRFAPQCLQPLRSPRQNHYFGVEGTSEDCLYLNIWAPPASGARTARRLPVIIWIYGGGFNIGSASMANYSGEALARDGVVRVNIAYRVGPLGFLAHPELSRETGYGGSGNYGLMDQVAALHWVQRNISRFGGDPGNVTIVGQSAGSMSVALLQASPPARGLFHRAVAMSGSPFGGMLGPTPLATGEAQGLALQQSLGATSLADLRALPGDRISAATTPRDAIVTDGEFVTGPISDVFAARQQHDVPLLLGFTRDESFAPLPPVATRAALLSALNERWGERAATIIAAYGVTNDAGVSAAASAISRDASVGRQMAEWAAHQQRFGTQPAFAYLFTRRQPYTPGIAFSDHDPATVGAYHTGDVPYWLRTRASLNLFRETRTWEPVDAAIEEEMARAILSFARTGQPVSPTLGRWPAFDAARPQLVVLGEEQRVAAWPNHAALSLFAGPPPARAPGDRRVRD